MSNGFYFGMGGVPSVYDEYPDEQPILIDGSSSISTRLQLEASSSRSKSSPKQPTTRGSTRTSWRTASRSFACSGRSARRKQHELLRSGPHH